MIPAGGGTGGSLNVGAVPNADAMIRNLNEIYAAIALLPGDSHEKSRLQQRVRTYRAECGCGMSGVFLVIAFLVTVFHQFYAGSFDWRSVVAGVAFIVGAALAGKALGIAWARTRLLLLRRSIARQIASN